MSDRRSAEAETYRRWYKTARWQRIRAAQLATEPLCRMCMAQGKITPASVCDHVEPHKGDPVKFWGGPFQSLCDPHHSEGKQQIERRGYSNEIGPDGYFVDPNHPSNR